MGSREAPAVAAGMPRPAALRRRPVDPAVDPPSHLLHVDADAVCPRCLRWVAPHEFVRRTVYGPVQHEVCPVDGGGAREPVPCG